VALAYVGRSIRSRFLWSNSDGPVATGTAVATIASANPSTGAEEYLQGDFSTLSGSPHQFPLALVGTRFVLQWAIPSSLADRCAVVEAVHSDPLNPVQALSYDVTAASADDIYGSITPPTSAPRLAFGPGDTG